MMDTLDFGHVSDCSVRSFTADSFRVDAGDQKFVALGLAGPLSPEPALAGVRSTTALDALYVKQGEEWLIFDGERFKEFITLIRGICEAFEKSYAWRFESLALAGDRHLEVLGKLNDTIRPVGVWRLSLESADLAPRFVLGLSKAIGNRANWGLAGG